MKKKSKNKLGIENSGSKIFLNELRKILVLVFLFSISLHSQAQYIPCGFDSLVKIRQQQNPDFQNQLESINSTLDYFINSPSTLNKAISPYDMVVPVVVHIVRDPAQRNT